MEGEQLDSIDAQQTATKEVQRKRTTEPHMAQKRLYSETKSHNGKNGGTFMNVEWETRNCMEREE